MVLVQSRMPLVVGCVEGVGGLGRWVDLRRRASWSGGRKTIEKHGWGGGEGGEGQVFITGKNVL